MHRLESGSISTRSVAAYRDYRKVLYALPLLVHWIFAVTFETEQEVVRIAKRSMVLFVFYLGTTLFLLFIDNLAAPYSFYFYVNLFAFYAHLTAWLAYLSISFYMAWSEWKLQPRNFTRLDRWADRIEQWLSA